MSLPDTVFIFVLALIIFGPKKLPEIGRQLGRLVGEFRRASNEFKFQIEEELRQVDFADKRSTPRTIAAHVDDTATASDESESTDFAQDPHDPAENFPVGQHPNIDNLDTSEFNASAVDAYGMDPYVSDDVPSDSALEAANAEPAADKAAADQAAPDQVISGQAISDQAAPEMTGGAVLPETPASDIVPTITPAEGSQPRTTIPVAAADSTLEGRNVPFPQPTTAEDDLSPLETPPSANHHPAPAEAEVTHG